LASAPKIGTKEIEAMAADLCANGNLLDPDLPPAVLASKILSDANSEFLEEYGRTLIIQDFSRRIRAERRKDPKRKSAQFPLFEHLPARIVGDREKRVPLEDATYSDVRRYCKMLARGHTDRKKQDTKLVEAKALMEVMRKASRKQRGITVGEVLSR
jgi:hypothetical protein